MTAAPFLPISSRRPQLRLADSTIAAGPIDPGTPELLARWYELLERLDAARQAEHRTRVDGNPTAIADAEWEVAAALGAVSELDHQAGCALGYMFHSAIRETPNTLLTAFEKVPLVAGLREQLAETRADVASLTDALSAALDRIEALEARGGAA
jgi:hypothetical protein